MMTAKHSCADGKSVTQRKMPSGPAVAPDAGQEWNASMTTAPAAGHLLNLGQILSANARLQPNRIGARDLERSMSFATWNERACRLANGLLGLGLGEGRPGGRARL